MSEQSFSVGHDGTRFVLTSTIDGTVRTARLAAGSHTDQEHDAALVKMRASYAALRQWKTDADTAVAAWDGRTVAQNMAVLKVVVQRFGALADGMADLLQTLNADT